MSRKEEDRDFVCILCKNLERGSYRNHCPFRLTSLHLDQEVPVDRKSACHGIMIACGIRKRDRKGWQIMHRCMKCGHERANKIADLHPQPDDWMQIFALSIKK